MDGLEEIRSTLVADANLAVGAATQVYPRNLLVVGNLTIGAGGSLTVKGKLTVYGTITNAGTLVCLSLECGGTLDNTGATALTVYADCKTGGTLTNTTATITVGGNCEVGGGGNLTTTTGNVTINGNCNLSGAFTASGAGNTIIKGTTFIAGILTLSNTGDLTVSGNLRCDSIVISNAGAVLTVEGNCEVLNTGTSVNMTAAGQVKVKKDLYCAGGCLVGAATLTVYGKADVGDSFGCTTGSIAVYGDCHCWYDLAPVGAGGIFIVGNLFVGNDFRPTTGTHTLLGSVFVANNLSLTTGTINIGGNLQVKGTTTVSGAAGALHVYGDAELNGAVGATNGTATITIDGISRIYGAITATGTVTYKGVYPQVAVNINAINASETNFFNLALTTGFHWNVRDLVLKSADPGVNTISVRLYQLVNGVLTNTHTFIINTAGALIRGTSGGFALYFSLDDMFTKQELADDNMKITVQASAGGPYAVTGGYKYSSGSMPSG